MPNWKLEIEYEGTRYRGWQIQHNAKTVQGELMAVARELFAARTEIGGAGRTDAGVHAVSQIAHLRVEDVTANITPKQIQFAFNDLLPHDINIKKVSNAPDNFDARRDAFSRYYLYQISTRRTAFSKNLVWWIKDTLNVSEMQECAAMLVGRNNFQSFYEIDEDKKTINDYHGRKIGSFYRRRFDLFPPRRKSFLMENGQTFNRNDRRSRARKCFRSGI